MVQSKPVTGIERDRSVLRGVALSIIRKILEKPTAPTKDSRKDWLAPPPLRSFIRLEPLGFGLHDDDDWWIFHPEDCSPDVVWPLNVGTITEGNNGNGLTMSVTKTITLKQARGYASKFGPFMVRSDHAQMVDGQLHTCAGLYVWLGGRWQDAQKRRLYETPGKDVFIPSRDHSLSGDDAIQPMLATGVALRQRYEWAVCLGLEHSPSVRFATDTTGIKEIFKIRDLPEGRDRRDALLGWVGEHWRQDRNDPEIEIYVRKHLRGRTEFTWRGMQCELLPSQFDVEQRDRFVAEREAMKAGGMDRRKAG